MKKFLLLTLCCLLSASMMTSALANGWGLRGGIYDIVTDDDRFEDYVATADDGNFRLGDRHFNHAILANRYHAVLISANRDGGKWAADTISTTAVYQPGDERDAFPNGPALSNMGDRFKLLYGDAEAYTFALQEGEYCLREVRYVFQERLGYSNSFMAHPDGLLFWQSGPGEAFLPVGELLWQNDGITLEEFNITQMPRSLAEVRQSNFTRSALDAAAAPLTVCGTWSAEEKGRRLPVYAAPEEGAWRAAEGKASVSTGGDFDLYGSVGGWTMIGYEVSGRTSRIGYIHEESPEAPALALGQVALVTAADTFLTDDPFVSQYAQAHLPAGTPLTGFARCGEYYAYVEYAGGEQLMRGFVPLKDLLPRIDEARGGAALTAEVRWDVIDALTGKWHLTAGGSEVSDLLILYADGTFRFDRMLEETDPYRAGFFRVFDAPEDLYLLCFYTAEGDDIATFTLQLNVDASITLSFEDGEGTYTRNEYSTYGNG